MRDDCDCSLIANLFPFDFLTFLAGHSLGDGW